MSACYLLICMKKTVMNGLAIIVFKDNQKLIERYEKSLVNYRAIHSVSIAETYVPVGHKLYGIFQNYVVSC